MRIRTLKPEFWSDPKTGQWPPELQNLAIGTLNLADDEGFFLSDSRLVRANLRPFDEKTQKISELLKKLESEHWIETRHCERNGPISLILNFTRHQRVDRPSPSKLRELFEKLPRRGFVEDSSSPRAFVEDSSSPRARFDEGSLLERKGREGKGTGKGIASADALAIINRENELLVKLEEIWKLKRPTQTKAPPDAEDLKALRSLMKRFTDDEICRFWGVGLLGTYGKSVSTFWQLKKKWPNLSAPEPRRTSGANIPQENDWTNVVDTALELTGQSQKELLNGL